MVVFLRVCNERLNENVYGHLKKNLKESKNFLNQVYYYNTNVNFYSFLLHIFYAHGWTMEHTRYYGILW